MTDKLVLAIDVGSQSTRAGLFLPDGTRCAVANVPAASATVGTSGIPAEHFWRDLKDACDALANQHPELWSSVAGVALCTQRGTTIFCDEDGTATCPAVSWSHAQTARDLPALSLPVRAALRVVGASELVKRLRAQAPANIVRASQPEVFARSSRIVLLSTWLTHRLCERWRDSTASQVGYVPFHFGRGRWHHKWNWRWQALGGLRRSHLPDLTLPGQVLGHLSAAAASALALPARLPVLAAAADKACEALGSGGHDGDTLVLSLGTAAAAMRPQSRFGHVRRFIPAFPSPQDGHFLFEVQVAAGMQRLRALAALPDVGTIDRADAGLDTWLATTQPGAYPGEPAANLPPVTGDARAWLDAVFGSTMPAPERAARALTDALLFELRYGADYLANRCGPAGRVVVTGGAARSDELLRVVAGVFGLPTWRPRDDESSLRGVAMCAAAGLGWYADVAGAREAMSPTLDVIKPEASESRRYAALYEARYRENIDRTYQALWSPRAGHARLRA